MSFHDSTVSRCVVVLLMFCCQGFAADLHADFQAVDANGNSTFTGSSVVLEGIILNSPEQILDPTPNYSNSVPPPFNMGGQWQIYIQGEGADHAGTAVYIGQNYSMTTGGTVPSYTNAEWLSELCRLNHDPVSGYRFSPGDRVRVTGYWLPYRGKANVNEQHDSDPAYDFTVELLEAGAGLPQAEVVTLDDLKDDTTYNDADDFIFTATRSYGCEYYQGRLIRIKNVQFVDASGWAADATLKITDGSLKADGVTLKTFPVKLGRGSGIYAGSNNLPTTFDIVGILDQEDSASPYQDGYRLWVPNYDGNGQVLWDRGYSRGNLAADTNRDGIVNSLDLLRLRMQWLMSCPGIAGCP